jgi:hypothetical protein
MTRGAACDRSARSARPVETRDSAAFRYVAGPTRVSFALDEWWLRRFRAVAAGALQHATMANLLAHAFSQTSSIAFVCQVAALAAGAGDMKSTIGLDAQVIPFDEPRPPAFSDEALALRFAELHASNLRYVEAWGKWLAWDGLRWRFDDTLRAFDRARVICREAASRANDPRVQMAVASAKTVVAVNRLAKADRRLAAKTDQWDANPWLLQPPGLRRVTRLRKARVRSVGGTCIHTALSNIRSKDSPRRRTRSRRGSESVIHRIEGEA